MTPKAIVSRLLEAGPDPDDPAVFVRHYKDAWERAGFQARLNADRQEQWVWREGIFSVEVTHHRPEDAEHEQWRAVRGAANWEIYGFIDIHEGKVQNAYARKVVSTEDKALAVAVRLKNEIMNSMAARLTKLGFTGWRNHWHRPPITVTLKKNYANIALRLDYTPNEKVIPALTMLTKAADKIQNG